MNQLLIAASGARRYAVGKLESRDVLVLDEKVQSRYLCIVILIKLTIAVLLFLLLLLLVLLLLFM